MQLSVTHTLLVGANSFAQFLIVNAEQSAAIATVLAKGIDLGTPEHVIALGSHDRQHGSFLANSRPVEFQSLCKRELSLKYGEVGRGLCYSKLPNRSSAAR